MIDGLPSGTPGRYSVGSWGRLLFAVLFGLASGAGIFWMLSYMADCCDV